MNNQTLIPAMLTKRAVQAFDVTSGFEKTDFEKTDFKKTDFGISCGIAS